MGLSASQGRMLLLTARKSDLEFRAQQISQKRLLLSQQLEEVALDYEEATSNRKMSIRLYLNGEASDNENVTQTSNLTYAALISGTKMMSSTDSGMVLGGLEQGGYASTTPYRLVDAYGAIVVSSEEEISTYMETRNSAVVKEPYKNNIYQAGNYDGSSFPYKPIGVMTNYVLAGKDTGSAYDKQNNKYPDNYTLADLFRENQELSKKELALDSQNGLIKIQDPNNSDRSIYFSTATGTIVKDSDITDEFSQISGETVNIISSTDDLPESNLIKTGHTTKAPDEGADNKWTVYDASGNPIARYIVDPTLKSGTTDVAGDKNGPNYLQDCLRNGKYLIEKATVNPETGKYQWRGISWDTTANIFDGYYTDDDDKAKAKYDRLQAQIQAQDKKLELELDNVETQRTAVTTEMESVKKVIQENIEGSFNAFG